MSAADHFANIPEAHAFRQMDAYQLPFLDTEMLELSSHFEYPLLTLYPKWCICLWNWGVQFGKYPFMFYDLAKFQYFFNKNKANVGVEIVPCRKLQKEMSTGVSYGEQLVYDIERLERHFPSVPVKIILVDI